MHSVDVISSLELLVMQGDQDAVCEGAQQPAQVRQR